MPKIDGESKEELLSTRVTAAIKDAVSRESRREGLTASEWLRTLIVKELKEREALPTAYRFPGIESK